MISVVGGLVAIVGVIVGFLDGAAQLGGRSMPTFIVAQFIVSCGLAVGVIGIGFALLGLPDQGLQRPAPRRYPRPPPREDPPRRAAQPWFGRTSRIRPSLLDGRVSGKR